MDIDNLEWSDDEDEHFYDLGGRIVKAVVLVDGEDIENNENGTNNHLFDHKRSKVFCGNVHIKKTAEATSRKGLFPVLATTPFTGSTSVAVEKLGLEHAQQLFTVVSRLGLDTDTNFLSVRLLQDDALVSFIRDLYHVSFDSEIWQQMCGRFENDDFISFNKLAELLYDAFGSVVPHERSKGKKIIFACSCANLACNHQRYYGKAFSSSAKIDQGPVVDVDEVDGREEDDEGEDDDMDNGLKFKIEVLYQRIRTETKGKIRVRHLQPILEELFVPFDLRKVPQSYWNNKGEFLLSSAEALISLVKAVQVEEEKAEDPLAHLFRYPLPDWLREEFKPSEILLYQHHFTLIDQDGGGSIDVYELQSLFHSLGSLISLEQAQAILDEYDIDGGGTVDFTEFMILIYKVQRGTIDLGDNGLAKVINEAKSQLKIFEEIEEVNLHPPEHCRVEGFGGSPVTCEVLIEGPDASAFAGYGVALQLTFLEGYPFFAPVVEILTRIVSPNVLMQVDGRGRLLHLGDVWDSTWSISKVLEHVYQILAEPDLSLLPLRFFSIYEQWSSKLQEVQEQQIRDHDQENEVEKEHGPDIIGQCEDADEGTDDEKNIKDDKNFTGKGNAKSDTDDTETQEGTSLANHEIEGRELEIDDLGPAQDQTPTDTKDDETRTNFLRTLTPEALSSPAIVSKIEQLPRMEQMHLSLLFMHLVDQSAFQAYIRQVIERYGRKLHQPEE